MARRVLDDVVLLNRKYDDLKDSEELRLMSKDVNNLMVSDVVPRLQMKKSTVKVDLSIIDVVINAYNRIDIKDDNCFLELQVGNVPVPKNKLRFLKALLSCVTSPSEKFVTCIVTFTQHVFKECLAKTGPSAILSNTDDKVVDLIYKELSDFYVENCG